MRHAFPDPTLEAITASVRSSEQTHGGEIRVAIEADLSLEALWSGMTARQRALQVFAFLGVWDTAARNGVLIYLCLADHAVEIITDRGLLCAGVSDAPWAEICTQLQNDCAAGHYQQGMCTAVISVGQLLRTHYPQRDHNEQADRPVVL
jgi:uncharacterized membrane protein